MMALRTAATGMAAQQLNVEVISNNIANMNTVAFKKQRAEFQDLLYQTIRASAIPLSTGTQTAIGVQVGVGAKPVATQKIYEQGPVNTTNNPLDLMIDGEGFFQVQVADGTMAYSRDGGLKQDGDGHIVTSDGYKIQPEIVVPPETSKLTISAEGKVFATIPGQVQPDLIGEIELAKFTNPAGLDAKGQNLLVPTPASGDPILGIPGQEGFGEIRQGFLESSNVQVVQEMVSMIMSQRAYEASAKTITAADQMLSMANNLRSGA